MSIGDNSNFITLKKAAELAGISPKTYKRHIDYGYVPPGYRIGGQTLYKATEIPNWPGIELKHIKQVDRKRVK
jgi:hypothetical protein